MTHHSLVFSKFPAVRTSRVEDGGSWRFWLVDEDVVGGDLTEEGAVERIDCMLWLLVPSKGGW